MYLLADQHRADVLGCAGDPVVQTPNIDRLAAEGVRFARMWCQSPICQPSRASIITERHPHQHGITSNFNRDFDPSWPTMMKSLQGAGYETATVGKTHYYTPDFRSGPIDLREREAFVASFGWDHVFEEFDRYVHAIPSVTTRFTEYLDGLGLIERYGERCAACGA